MIAFHRSAAVRIAVLFLALFTCAVTATFGLTYMLVREEIVQHLRANIVAGADAIAARLLNEPPDVVLSSSSRQRVAALFDADGSLVFGEPGLRPVIGWREVPAQPRRVPHFHINLLPEARKVSTTRALMSAYLSYLYRSGEKRVYGQIVTFESRRGEKMFERYGFKVLNRAEITKYKAFYPESVYLSTVIKNLETAGPLSAYSRVRE